MRTPLTAARIALWCVLVLTAIASWFILRQEWYERRREEIMEQRAGEFMRYTPSEWAAVGEACQTYWRVAKNMEDELAAQPPLPPLLEGLTVRYVDVGPGSEGFTLYWSDGFFGEDDLCLRYEVTENTGRLFLKCSRSLHSVKGALLGKEVWSTAPGPPRSQSAL